MREKTGKKQKKVKKALKRTYNSEKRLVPRKERAKTLMAALQELDKISVRKVAKALGISKSTAWRLLSNEDYSWDEYRKKAKRKIDLDSVQVLEKLLQVLKEGRVSTSQAGILTGILYDKLWPATGKPLAEINVAGESKIVKVYYPNFKPANPLFCNEESMEPKKGRDSKVV